METPDQPATMPTSFKPDLDSRGQIHDAVVAFYREVVFDDVLGPVFDEVADVDWAIHMPTLVSYWCRVLLGESTIGLPMLGTHARIHALEPLTLEMFDRWYSLWASTIDERWAGPGADKAKGHASRVGATMARRVSELEWSAPAITIGSKGRS